MGNNPKRAEYIKKIRQAHDYALQEKEIIRRRIEASISDIDAIELLAHIAFISQCVPKNDQTINQSLREYPSLHYLAGLCLKKRVVGTRPPENKEVEAITEDVNQYFANFMQDITLQSFRKEQVSDEDGLVLQARIQKMLHQTSAMLYPFQLETLINGLFSQFDDYFLSKAGFRASKALEFGTKIIKRYERMANKRYEEVGSARKRAAEELKDPVKGLAIRATMDDSLSDEDLLSSYTAFLLFTNIKEIFLFKPDVLCREEDISDLSEFANYVKALCCEFGSNQDFNNPLDINVISVKPFIKGDGDTYFVPISQDLIHNLPLVLESLLEQDKLAQSGIWQRYQSSRANHIEGRICEFLSRIFPIENIFRNAKYVYQGKECEADAIVLYDNKIFLFEAKAGSFGEKAQRGGIESLKKDLKKLIEEAYQQGRRTAAYIKSNKISTFSDSQGKKILELSQNNQTIFIIGITLDPLMSLAIGLKNLRSLGLFIENEYPWSVQINELDLVTRHLPSPTIFIHYIERRLRAIDENVFHAYDELSFLGWYLRKGNFSIPYDRDGKQPNLLEIASDWTRTFDEHYLFGKEKPELDIENELLKIIRILEYLNPVGYSDLASALLDFDHQARKLILEKINELIALSKRDLNPHDFSVIYKDDLDTGLTFMAQAGRDVLREHLGSYCTMKKYQTKTKIWLGLGRDVQDDRWFVNEFVYLKYPWKHEDKMDELLRAFPMKDKGT
ncbi:MAG: hypothetical protein ABSG73_11035 [Candidatus Aminicenantales bacterium]|jgi:hypothetical protein